MMEFLDKKLLKEEIEKCKITVENLERGLAINKFVLKAFEDALVRRS